MTSLSPPPQDLPGGFHGLRRLATSPLAEVWQAERDGESVVLRLDRGPDGQGLAELAVLSAVEHPSLARLVDYGVLPGGGRYLARRWIEGQDLLTWLQTPAAVDALAVGRLIAGICLSLSALHRAGFVHGDLKARNVIVDPHGDARLTDFGLARRSGLARETVAGSAYAIAPELLFGEAPDPRSDLFALGALMVEVFGGLRASPQKFYARFPAVEFFQAAECRPSDLPEWLADLAAQLVERDGDRRPGSAALVGRVLCSRLGFKDLARQFDEELDRPRVTARFGREHVFEAWSRELFQPGTRAWIRVAPEEDAEGVARELSVQACLGGRAVRRESPPPGGTESDVEGWIASLETLGLGDAPAFAVLALQAGDPAQRRAASLLARALAPTCGLVVVSSEPGPSAEPPWRAAVLEPLELEALEPWVERWMEAEPEANRRQFARALHTACGGSASALDQIAERAVQRKWVLRGGRLRPGPVPTASELGLRGDPTQEGLSPGELALARVLALSGGRAAMELCLAALGPDLVQSKASLAALASRGRLRLHGGREPTLEWCGALEAQRFPLEDRRATAARVAEHLERVEGEALKSGSGAESGLAASGRVLARQAWGAVADPNRAEDFARALSEARERGSPEAAISSAEFVRNALGQACDSRLTGELALAYGQIGLLDRALELSAELAQDDQARGRHAPPRDAATAERVRGRVALLRHEPALALEHFERAAGLDRDDGGEALLARVQLAAQLGRDAEVLELAGTASAAPVEVQPRLLRAIEVYGAMSLVRTGEIGRAREILTAQLAQAIELHDDLRVAALSMNLGTLERRAGELQRSLAHFERADACATRARSATQSAQIRGASAALTRDLGELARAEEFSLSALSMRLRLGDHAGAQVARGILALVLAERGHVGRAAAEAELAAAELGKSGRLQDAELLSCTAVECRARLGVAPEELPEGVRDPAGAGDPRALLTLARAQAYSGHLVPAREPARRAADLAGRLGLEPVRVQAQCWLELLAAPRAIPQVAGAEDQPLLRLDLELQRLLASEPLDVPGAGRLALELERRGRDDRLARLWIAVAARASGIETQRSAWAKAEAALARCALGARQGTELALRSNLLAVPEPWPEDHVLARAAAQQDGEHEMDVLRLLEINHRLVEQPNLTALLGEIVDCALSVSGAERGFLVLEKDGELEFDTALDSRRGDIPLPEMEISRSILSEALGAMRPLRLSNAAEDPALGAAASVIALELRSVLCAPFRIDKQARGVIYVDHRLKSGAFTDRAERMLSLLADQASLAITQVRRMDEIRRLNRRLNQRMVEAESELKSNQRALARAGLSLAAGGLVGSSPAMREVQRQIDLASQARLAVLLQGPSGSGKELAARAVHARSSRSEDPFVCENCAALPPALIEAEFFGSVRGAFTGAERDRAGLFERADHGTLFLDEIGELPLELQAKLLRVLESGEVRRLGSTDVRKVDVRLVSATNRDLAREVREGRFRADLYYRVEGMRIVLPSLEARGEDIPELVDHFLRLSAEPGAAPRRVSPAVLARLAARPWPGNVRELRNEVARLCLLSPGDLLDPDRVSEPELALSPHAPDQLLTLADLERDAILRALRATGGDKNEAARRLGISRAKIYQRLKEWGVG